MSEIEPALTPEEWVREGGLMDEIQAREGWFEASVHEPADRHRIAALALHGQPFGFTWDDVAGLREITSAYIGLIDQAVASPASIAGEETLAQQLRALADRIAALLPPREGEG